MSDNIEEYIIVSNYFVAVNFIANLLVITSYSLSDCIRAWCMTMSSSLTARRHCRYSTWD